MKYKSPQTFIKNPLLTFIPIKLAKLGYFEGKPSLIRKAPAPEILEIIAFEKFQIELEEETDNLNNKK